VTDGAVEDLETVLDADRQARRVAGQVVDKRARAA